MQLTVAQGLSSKKLDYDTLKAKIKLMANVQSDNPTPQPMDIGEMQCYDEDVNVEVVGVQKGKGKGPAFGTCWTCGGSHFARSCPKGNNKGQKGFGKAEEADQSDVWVLLDLRRQPLFEGVSERRWQQCKGWRQKQ